MLILQNRDELPKSKVRRNSRPLFILTHEFHPRKGGIATFTEEMALSCSQQGFDVEVWAPDIQGEVSDKPWPFKVRRLNMKGTQDLPCLMAMSKEIIGKRRDLRRARVYLPEPGPISAMLYLQFFKAFQSGRPGHKFFVITHVGTPISSSVGAECVPQSSTPPLSTAF